MSFRILDRLTDERFTEADMTKSQWTKLQAAAGFVGVSGCRADQVVVNDVGHIWIIDSTDRAHAVDSALFVGSL